MWEDDLQPYGPSRRVLAEPPACTADGSECALTTTRHRISLGMLEIIPLFLGILTRPRLPSSIQLLDDPSTTALQRGVSILGRENGISALTCVTEASIFDCVTNGCYGQGKGKDFGRALSSTRPISLSADTSIGVVASSLWALVIDRCPSL